MKKGCLIVGIWIILSNPLFAQKDTAKSTSPTNLDKKGDLIMDLGAGLSTISWLVEGIAGGPNITAESPVMNSAFDYYVTNRMSFGLGVAFQEIKNEPANGDIPIPGVVEYITRTNVALRLLAHLGKSPDIDYYLGARVGISFWTDNETPDEGHYSLGFVQYGTNSAMRESVQILFGLRFNPSELLGIHIEGGIGTPYFLEGGISIRLLKSKGNK